MSYEPSHRRPPRQERWPSATPGEGWPAYRQDDGGQAREPAEAFAGSRDGYGAAGNGYRAASNGHGAGYGHRDAWDGARYGDPGQAYRADGNRYGGTTTAYPAAGDGSAGNGSAGNGYAGNGYAGDGYAGNGYAGNGYAGNGYAGDGYAGNGHADGFDGATDGYGGGYRDGTDGYGAAERYGAAEDDYEAPDGWDGYTQPGHESTGRAGYLAQDDDPAPDPGAASVLVAPDTGAASVLVAPDTAGEWWRQPHHGGRGDRDQADRGPVVGAVIGLLAAAVAIGVATLGAAFIRPQASPVSAVGGVLVGRLPASLRNHLMAHVGAHTQALLLLGVIGLIAIALGAMTRRNPSAAVAGLAAFGLLGAFIAITRPGSRASDVIPSVVGALAGIAALLWLARASAPAPRATSSRPVYGDGRRRAR